MIATKESMAMAGGETKSKLVFLVLHLFVAEHILAFRTDLIGIVSLRMFKWDAILKNGTFLG